MTAGGMVCARCGRPQMGRWTRCASCGEPCPPDPFETQQLADVESPASPAPARPTNLDPARRYRLLDTLGKGATGTVYKVADVELDEIIALKVLDPRIDSPAARERFKREIKIARRINHPNVARLYDLLMWGGRLAISQEYIEGQDLARQMRARPYATEEICGLLRYLCSALDAAHAHGVVHRDLKPQNILIDSRGRPHIVDFGTAALGTMTAQDDRKYIFGTPAYVSPEQLTDPRRIERRSDIYSLGVILFQLATGSLPFAAQTKKEMLAAHVNEPPRRPRSVRPGVPLGLEEVTLRCLAKEPSHRYGSAQELLHDLEQRLRHEHHDVPPPIAVHPSMKGKILLVDDDDDLRQWVRTVLRGCGAVVVEATDGYRGVESALVEKPDLILLDILMPNLDGREALRILKANRITASIPVVMVTSLTDEEEALFSKESGAAAFLNKPVQRDVLELLVERYLAPAAVSRAS